MDNQEEDDRRTAEKLNNLSKQQAEELSKYTYFILAVAGAAIAYALKSIEGKPPSYALFFAAASILCWALSFGFGVRNLNSFRQHLSINANCILNRFTAEEMLTALAPCERQASSESTFQFGFLVLGALFYLVFHLVEIWVVLEACNA
jgi:hypothetical protein